MNARSRFTFVSMAMAGSLLLCPLVTQAAESRTKEQCTTLFRELNTSGNGHLTMSEASKNKELATALSAPSVWKQGYLTEEDFTPLCVTDTHNEPRG